MKSGDMKIRLEEYILVFLLMCASGNPAFMELGGSFIYLLIVLFTVVVFSRRIPSLAWRKVLQWALLLLVIFIGQLISLHKIGYLASLNYVFKIATAILAVYILKEKFAPVYLKLMVLLSGISLFCWTLNVFGIYLPTFFHFGNHTDSLLLYTQAQYGYHTSIAGPRNFGMFWEPGAFSGYIMVTFLLYINRLDYLWTNHRGKVILLVAALLTTFSTTGYIIFFVLVFFFLNDRVKNRVSFVFLAIIAALLMIRFFTSTGFLGSKIEGEYESAIMMDEYDVNFSRFGAMIFDWQYIKLHPIFGNGLLNETRFSMHISFADDLAAFGNGFSGEIATFGIPFMLFYLFAVYQNPYLRKKWRLLLLLVLQLQGEYFLNYPLFFIFPFVMYYREELIDELKPSIVKPQVIV